ncbi:probable inactive beta-glucosidase 14 [Typha latifolia]|uniref:probable inactive beta-glucosidase 14 n=1 Tax=Typha latifolia TaxID=4733 RepID=UPI003C2ACB50
MPKVPTAHSLETIITVIETKQDKYLWVVPYNCSSAHRVVGETREWRGRRGIWQSLYFFSCSPWYHASIEANSLQTFYLGPQLPLIRLKMHIQKVIKVLAIGIFSLTYQDLIAYVLAVGQFTLVCLEYEDKNFGIQLKRKEMISFLHGNMNTCMISPCEVDDYNGNALVFSTGDRNGVPIGNPTAVENIYVVPYGMEKVVMYIKQRYNNTPMYITENGYPDRSDDSLSISDLTNDVERVEYIHGHLTALSSAIWKGADVRGYFLWSLLDNFEWLMGYTVRFGLYHVDFKTQERTPKLSAKWYRNFLRDSNLLLNKNEDSDQQDFSSLVKI